MFVPFQLGKNNATILKNRLNIQQPGITELNDPLFSKKRISVSVARLDEIHPQISGNKYYKLRCYLDQFSASGCSELFTFGGPYSNHLHAFAFASNLLGIKAGAYVRGEKPAMLSSTLQDCLSNGLKLIFLSRSTYNEKKEAAISSHVMSDQFLIPEGGFGKKGVEGARQIYKDIQGENYTHILAACGTGTMIAGLLEEAKSAQQIIGIPVLKGFFRLSADIFSLLGIENDVRLRIFHDYSFGGYARYDKDLLAFMNTWYNRFELPSDFIYTGKLFFAVNDMIENNYFPSGSRIMIIHSGGLQGNRSLPEGSLLF